jgi:hypothetical protein
MALYIPRSIFHLARLLYVRPETFGPYHVPDLIMIFNKKYSYNSLSDDGGIEKNLVIFLTRSWQTERQCLKMN